MNISIVFVGTLVLVLTAFLFAIAVSAVTHIFHSPEDPRIKKIHDDILPHFNCGACGYPGCMPYATAIIDDGEIHNKCRPGGEKVAQEILTLLEETK